MQEVVIRQGSYFPKEETESVLLRAKTCKILMTNKVKALSFSLLLHVGMAFGCMLLCKYPAPEPPLLVIDFSMVASAAEPGQTSGPEEQKIPASAPPVIEKRDESEKPPDIPEKNLPKEKLAREKLKKHLAPSVDKKEEVPHPPETERNEQQSSPIADEKSSRNNTAAGQSVESETVRQERQSTAIEPMTESGKGDGGASKNDDFQFVRDLIVKNVSFPISARRMGLTGKIVVAFLLKEDGQVENITVVESTGHDILDSNVVATIRRISPFPKPPAAARIVLPITFHLQ